MTGVAFVLVGFIDHAQAFRRESLGQLLRDQIVGSRHGSGLAMTGSRGQSSMLRAHAVSRASFLFVKLAGADAPSA
jgi:hypothetical protein